MLKVSLLVSSAVVLLLLRRMGLFQTVICEDALTRIVYRDIGFPL